MATGWRQPATGYDGPLEAVGYMQTLTERVGPHGGPFHYQSIPHRRGRRLPRTRTGRPFAELFAERIWHPIGAEHDLVTIVDAAGLAIFEGGFNCTLPGLRPLRLAHRRGRARPGAEGVDRRLPLPGAGARRRLRRGRVRRGPPRLRLPQQVVGRDPARGVIMALGIHGQTLYIDPERAFAVAKFSSQPGHDDLDMALDQVAAFEAVARELAGG